MGEKIRRFVPRAARYVLRPGDTAQMRFSLFKHHGSGGIEETILINLSETGAAFLVDNGHAPALGEKIKVEIPIPHGETIAWFGRVVRVQEYQTSRWSSPKKDPFQPKPKIMVGLVFEELPEGHSRALRRGIEQSFMQAVRDQNYRNLTYYKTWIMHHVPRAAFYILLAAAAFGFIYYFTLPDSKYDAKRGAPWGERF